MEIPTQSIIHTTQSEKANMQQVEVLHNTHPKMNIGPQKDVSHQKLSQPSSLMYLINVLSRLHWPLQLF